MEQSVVCPVATKGMSCESHIFRVYRVYFFQVRNQVIYNKVQERIRVSLEISFSDDIIIVRVWIFYADKYNILYLARCRELP